MPVPNFKPNAMLESFGDWGTGVKITLEDGTMLMVTYDASESPAVSIKYFVVTKSTTETAEAKVRGASGLFDYLHDLTQ